MGGPRCFWWAVGLAVILALTVRAVSKATAHAGSAGLFHLDHSNAARTISSLVGTVSGGMLQVTNNSTATTATGLGVTNKSGVAPTVRATNAGGGPALGLSVASGKAPMTVNAAAGKATNLDADELDGKSSEQFASSGHQHSGADINGGTVEADFVEDGAGSGLDADKVDGKDSSVFLRDTYRESYESFRSLNSASGFCATTDYTPTYPQTALMSINASLSAGTSDLTNVWLRALYSTNGGTSWSNTSSRYSPEVDIPAGKEAALGYLDAFPLEPGVTYRFATMAVNSSGTAISSTENSYCQVLVTFINR